MTVKNDRWKTDMRLGVYEANVRGLVDTQEERNLLDSINEPFDDSTAMNWDTFKRTDGKVSCKNLFEEN